MNRTRRFALIMAIFWTVVAAAAVVLVTRMNLSTAETIVMAFLAFVAVVGNWLRYYKSK